LDIVIETKQIEADIFHSQKDGQNPQWRFSTTNRNSNSIIVRQENKLNHGHE